MTWSMLLNHQDYRVYLKNVLAEKCHGNRQYSQKAFSDKLRISNSFLSEILSGKKSLSMELAFKLAVRLELTDLETQYFCLLVQIENEVDQDFREKLIQKLAHLNSRDSAHALGIDAFRTISVWYHFAILELTHLTGFNLSAHSVSERLEISIDEAEAAIERLARLGLLKKDESSVWRRIDSQVLAECQVSNEAFKSYHQQHLQKAIDSLFAQAPNERVSSTDVLAIDSKYVSEVKRLSDEFTQAVFTLAKKSKVKDQVYSLSVHFFKLTKKRDKLC